MISHYQCLLEKKLRREEDKMEFYITGYYKMMKQVEIDKRGYTSETPEEAEAKAIQDGLVDKLLISTYLPQDLP